MIQFIVVFIANGASSTQALFADVHGDQCELPSQWGSYFTPQCGLLGEGGFAKVFSTGVTCYNAHTVPVALKVNSSEEYDDASEYYSETGSEALQMDPKREYDFLRSLSGKGIAIEAYGFATEREKAYMALELVEGGSLEDKIYHDTAFANMSAAELAKRLIEAVLRLHENSIIHRDIKPNNILVDQQNRVLLADFDMACSVKDTVCLSHIEHGTPVYRAPELVKKTVNQASESTDAFATGQTLAITMCPGMLSGKFAPSISERSEDGEYSEKLQWWLGNCSHAKRTEENLLKDVVFPLLKFNPANRQNLRGALQAVQKMETRELPQAVQNSNYETWTSCLRN